MSLEEFGGSCYYLSPSSYEMEKVEGEVEAIGADSIRRSKEVYESVIGIHHYTIQGYSLAKGMGPGKYVTSDTFTVGGYEWAVYFYPDGKNVEDNSLYVSLFISLVSEGTDVRALFGLTLVDQSGKGNHKVHSLFDRPLEVGPCTLKHRGSMWGYNRFSRRTSLSDYLKDDCIVMQCTIGVVKDHLHSALIRNNKFGVKAFKCANGYAALRHALRSDDARFQRKALNLIEYLIQENRSDSNTQTELGFPRLMVHLTASDDFSVREAALGALLELARDETLGDGSGSLVKEAKLKQFLQNRINNLSSMGAEDLAATREERQLLDSLWSTCYNEPSLLREKGLIVLPGEENVEESPPDVAANLFEPPLRAWAANNPT